MGKNQYGCGKDEKYSAGILANNKEFDEIRRINKSSKMVISADDILNLQIELGLCKDSGDFLSRTGYKQIEAAKTSSRNLAGQNTGLRGIVGYER
jgi:hypothetical protein